MFTQGHRYVRNKGITTRSKELLGWRPLLGLAWPAVASEILGLSVSAPLCAAGAAPPAPAHVASHVSENTAGNPSDPENISNIRADCSRQLHGCGNQKDQIPPAEKNIRYAGA